MVVYDRKPLDPALYSIEPAMAQVYKASTGIRDDEQLKLHILRVQDEAYRAFPYPYIRLFSFTKMVVTEIPSYKEAIRLGKRRSGAIFLEIGTGFGNDIRKVIADGFPIQDIVVSDINPKLWDIGHRLFRSDRTRLPVKFVKGDIFDETTLSSTSTTYARPEIQSLRTLTPLKGHVSVIFLQMVFHLWGEKAQLVLARRLAQLLSPKPGSLIIGRQMGDSVPRSIPLQGQDHFVHNPDSWEKMWSAVFPRGTVEYRTELRRLPNDLPAATRDMVTVTQFLTWSIRRL